MIFIWIRTFQSVVSLSNNIAKRNIIFTTTVKNLDPVHTNNAFSQIVHTDTITNAHHFQQKRKKWKKASTKTHRTSVDDMRKRIGKNPQVTCGQTLTIFVRFFFSVACRDNDRNCKGWTSYCSSNSYVKTNCKKTCNLC